MPVFRQSYHHHHPSSAVSNGLPLPSSTSRGRSLTPPSLKHNPRLAPMAHLRTQDFYYPPAPPPTHHHHHHAQQQHSSIYSDPSYYRNFTNDPYMMQRLPPTAFMSGNSSSRSYRTMYPSSDLDRSSSRPPHHHHQRRSRSRHRYEYISSLLRGHLRVALDLFSSPILCFGSLLFSTIGQATVSRVSFLFLPNRKHAGHLRQVGFSPLSSARERTPFLVSSSNTFVSSVMFVRL